MAKAFFQELVSTAAGLLAPSTGFPDIHSRCVARPVITPAWRCTSRTMEKVRYNSKAASLWSSERGTELVESVACFMQPWDLEISHAQSRKSRGARRIRCCQSWKFVALWNGRIVARPPVPESMRVSVRSVASVRSGDYRDNLGILFEGLAWWLQRAKEGIGVRNCSLTL